MSSTPLLEMRNISKSFGATRALHDVSISVDPGQVHILAGENGAGKSTLMKILTGVHHPNEGEIHFQGAPFLSHNPKDALIKGIAMIYQEFNLALDLPVHANVFLGHEIRRSRLLDFASQRAATKDLFQRFDMDIDPDMPVQRLGVSQRQMVEIARALSVDAPLIIMDEPTAALSQNETRKLFEVIRTLRSEGKGIIYISHYLEEYEEIGDVISVLRDGECVDRCTIAEATHGRIIQQMVGRKVDDLYPRHDRTPGPTLLSVSNLNSPNGTTDVTFDVRANEMVGIAGMVGAGRTEMLRALFGLDSSQVEQIQGEGWTLASPNPRRFTKLGVGLLSEDRAEEGLAQTMSIADNITLPVPEEISQRGVLSFRRQNEFSQELIERVGIKTQSPTQPVTQLSGGNQQKVALARLLAMKARVLLLDEPTRGIDVGSKAEIYKLIHELANQGNGVVMVSSYLPEILGMCDSVYVMYRNQLSRKYSRSEIDSDQIMALATGVAGESR